MPLHLGRISFQPLRRRLEKFNTSIYEMFVAVFSRTNENFLGDLLSCLRGDYLANNLQSLDIPVVNSRTHTCNIRTNVARTLP